MAPPKKKLKENIANVSEDDIFAEHGFLNNADGIAPQNRLLSSTPTLDSSIDYANHVLGQVNSASTTNQSEGESSRDSASRSFSRKRTLEEFLSETAHLKDSRSLFENNDDVLASNVSRTSRFDVTAFRSYDPNLRHVYERANPHIRFSPFYNGKTMYGGASAASQSLVTNILASSKQQCTLKSAIQISSGVNKPNSENSKGRISVTARKILDALEQFANPITESVKNAVPGVPRLVQNRARFGNEERLFNRLANKPYAMPLISTKRCFQRELQVATVPELLLMRKRLQESTQNLRELATTSNSDLIKPIDKYKLRTEESEKLDSKSTNKIRTKITNFKNMTSEKTPSLELPVLQLPITEMPKFDIKFPIQPSNTITNKSADNIIIKDRVEIPVKPNPFSTQNKFNFASPIKLDESIASVRTCNNFKFSSPIRITNKKVSTNAALNKTSAPKIETQIIEGNERKISNDSEMTLKNISSNTQDVMSINTTESKIKQVADKSFQNLISEQNAKWECSSCLTRNSNETIKCVCCETPKSQKPESKPSPIKTAKTDTISVIPNSFQSLLEKQKQKWKCDGCMTYNDQESSKCLCCETVKPAAICNKSTAEARNYNVSRVNSKITNTFLTELMNKQSLKWECNGCMTRNDQNKNKCACCEAPKPGALPEKEQFNFSSVPVTEFKFGMDKSEIEPPKNVIGTTVPTTTVVSGNTGSNFSFGMPTTKGSKRKPENEEKTNAFCVPAATNIATTTVPQFTFGIPAKTTVATHDGIKTIGASKMEPIISKNIPKVSVPSTSTSLFQFGSTSNTIPAASKKTMEQNKPFCIPTKANIPKTSSIATTQSAPVVPNNVFTFGASSPAYNGSIGSKTSNNASSVTSKSPTFVKPAPPAPLPVSLKLPNNKEPITEGSGPPSKKPVFSFGSNQSSTFKSPISNTTSQVKSDGINFKFGSISGSKDTVKPFSFVNPGNNPNTQKSEVFVFGSNGSNNNGVPNTFDFASGKTQLPTVGFDANKTSNVFGSSQTSALPIGSFGVQSSNVQQNNVSSFGTSSTLNNSTPAFTFGANTAQSDAQRSAVFTFGSAKTGSDAPATGGFNFSTAIQGGSTQMPNLNFTSPESKAPALSFNIGSAGSQAGPRKIKKALRRNPR